MLELDGDLWLEREIQLPFVPWIGLHIDLESNPTCYDSVVIVEPCITWNYIDCKFECFCELPIWPKRGATKEDLEPEQVAKILGARGWIKT